MRENNILKIENVGYKLKSLFLTLSCSCILTTLNAAPKNNILTLEDLILILNTPLNKSVAKTLQPKYFYYNKYFNQGESSYDSVYQLNYDKNFACLSFLGYSLLLTDRQQKQAKDGKRISGRISKSITYQTANKKAFLNIEDELINPSKGKKAVIIHQTNKRNFVSITYLYQKMSITLIKKSLRNKIEEGIECFTIKIEPNKRDDD